MSAVRKTLLNVRQKNVSSMSCTYDEHALLRVDGYGSMLWTPVIFTLTGHFIRYTCTMFCNSIQRLCTKLYLDKVLLLVTLSQVFQFNHVFIIEAIVKGGIVLDYII